MKQERRKNDRREEKKKEISSQKRGEWAWKEENRRNKSEIGRERRSDNERD